MRIFGRSNFKGQRLPDFWYLCTNAVDNCKNVGITPTFRTPVFNMLIFND